MSAGMARRAVELHAAFVRGFTEPARDDAGQLENLLAIRVGAQRFALRLSEIAGVIADKAITPIPGSGAELLGIAGFRGTILPVYDLRALLGVPATQPPRWLVIPAASPLAFAFEEFQHHLRAPPEAIVAQQGGLSIVRDADGRLPLLHLPSIIATLTVVEP